MVRGENLPVHSTEEVEVVVMIRGEYLPVHGTEEVEEEKMILGEYRIYLHVYGTEGWK
jgi:hypothetical protein